MLYEEFCGQLYNQIFVQVFSEVLGNRSSANARTDAEREAQKQAIRLTFTQALAEYGDLVEAKKLWKAIYIAHLRRKTDINDLMPFDEEIIQKVISADQSWKKSSGHAFESFIFETINPLLASSDIRFVLQKELTDMMHRGGYLQ